MLEDLTQHPDYFEGDYKERMDYMASLTGKFEYNWNYHYDGISAEDVLTDELKKLIHGKVIDVGCGHGEYTNRWADHAEEVVGYDMTAGFIATANLTRKSNVRYVVGRTHEGVPFPADYFDMAYTKKGPTSWYDEGNRIVKPGGSIVLLHPGDHGTDLGEYFPRLFGRRSEETPILNKVQERLAVSGLTDIHSQNDSRECLDSNSRGYHCHEI